MIKGTYQATITFDFSYEPTDFRDFSSFDKIKERIDDNIELVLRECLTSEDIFSNDIGVLKIERNKLELYEE